MKKIIALVFCILVFLVSYKLKANIESLEETNLEIIMESTGQKFTPNYYEENFDFKYELLPVVKTTSDTETLSFLLSNKKIKALTVHEDYYNENYIEKVNYPIEKDANEKLSLEINRRRNTPTQFGVYYISIGKGVYVFKLMFVTNNISGTADSLASKYFVEHKDISGYNTGWNYTGGKLLLLHLFRQEHILHKVLCHSDINIL